MHRLFVTILDRWLGFSFKAKCKRNYKQQSFSLSSSVIFICHLHPQPMHNPHLELRYLEAYSQSVAIQLHASPNTWEGLCVAHSQACLIG